MTDFRRAAAIVAGGLTVLFAFTAIYVAAYHAPRAKGFDVGVVGTPSQARQVQGALDGADRGAFDVRRYATEPQARSALLDTDVHGVLVPGPLGDRIEVAQAFGMPATEAVTKALEGVAASTHTPAAVADLRPLPAHDSRGLSSLFVVIATLIPSIVFGSLLNLLGRGLPARVRWTAVVVYGVGAGLLAALNADLVTGALTGHFVGIGAVCALLALAAAGAAHGLGHLLGPRGNVIAVVLLLLLGLSSTGGAVGYQFEPGFYGAISQLLPPGAALTAVRNVVYFDSAATLAPVIVLAVWAGGGFLAGLLAERLGAGRRSTRTANSATIGAPVASARA
jgi:hypothetical protein